MVKKSYGGKKVKKSKSKVKKPKSKKTRSKGKKECNGVMVIQMGLDSIANDMDPGHIPHHLNKHHTSHGNVRRSGKSMKGSRKMMMKNLRSKKSKSRSKLDTFKGNVRRGYRSMPGSRLAYDDTMQEKRKKSRRNTVGGKKTKKKSKGKKSAYSQFLSTELKRVGDANPDWPQPKVFKEAVSNWSNKKGGACGLKHGG